MTAILLFILLVIIAVVAIIIINQNKTELGSRAEDILLEQARVAELKAELEQVGIQEREGLATLRLEMQILEKENAKNVITLEKELIASGLKGKDAEDALRKELEETRLAEQGKVAAIQLQLDKTKTQEQAKVKSIQSELNKSQARIGLMEANVEKLKNKPVAEIADLKKKLSEAMVSTRDAQEKANAQASLVKAEKSESAKQLKVIQAELNTLKEAEADKRKTLNTRLGVSTDTIEDLEDEIAYLKNQAAVNKSPDIEKRKISIQSGEDRADAMDSQDIVENDEKKNSGNTPRSSSGRVITKGPKSLEMSSAMREKLQTARYKAENNEKNNDLKKGIGDARHTGPRPSIDLEKLGPPSNMMRPAVCRDIPGSAVDSCGRPSKLLGAAEIAAQMFKRRKAEVDKIAAEKAAAAKKVADEKAAAAKKVADKAAAVKKVADEKAAKAKAAAEKAAAKKAAAEKAAADKIAAEKAAAQKRADTRAKAAAEKAAAEKAKADRVAAAAKTEADRKAAIAAAAKKISDEKAAQAARDAAQAARDAAAKKKAADEEAARVKYRSNSGSGVVFYSGMTNVKLNAYISDVGSAGPSRLGGQFFPMMHRSTTERDYRKARNIVVR